jgi:hypothetical protein|tara:strand:- start:583 stop:804 length:222 start_codon:yes stop_codon:yes gene_type:complete
MSDNKFDNSGALWKRQAKDNDQPGKSYPHYTGNVTINGVKKNASAWLNTEKGTDPAKSGQPDINIKLQDPIAK